MARVGWLSKGKEGADQAHDVLSFFGVVSPEQWDELYAKPAVAFRRPQKFKIDEFALSAWLRAGLIAAERTPTEAYDENVFNAVLTQVRTLTCEPVTTFRVELPAQCARAGVVVAFVPELTGSRACGATRWVAPRKALIQLSLRYKTADHLWFTFFHEAAHILHHGKKLVFIEEGTRDKSVEENEANRWAADFLIPPHEFASFRTAGDMSLPAIRAFADHLGIATGIVVGRLQHEHLIPHAFGNSLKVRLQWTEAA